MEPFGTPDESPIDGRLARIEAKVDQLLAFVAAVVSTAEDARTAPGMQGMMARQMLPDLSQFGK